MKIIYEKPQIEVIEFELSESIMQSGIGEPFDVYPCFTTD